MHVHNLPIHLVRALAPRRVAAGFFVTLTLLSAACSKDPASSINAPAILSSSSLSSFVAASVPSLSTAANFAALGGTGVTCAVPNPPLPAITVSGGDVGSGSVAPTSVTGFPSLCSLSGTVRLGQTAAIADMITAYNALRDNNTCPSATASHNLFGSLTSGTQGAVLEPGVYCIYGVGLLTSQLTLNGGANATWVFKAESSITPIGGSVVMAGGGNACNVYWQVTSAVDLNNTAFVGNVLTGTAITFTGAATPTTGSSLLGRALAQSDVTMTGAHITACAAGNGGGNGNGKGEGDDDGDKDHHDKDHHDKDKDHGRDKGDKDKDHGGDHGDRHGGRDG